MNISSVGIMTDSACMVPTRLSRRRKIPLLFFHFAWSKLFTAMDDHASDTLDI